MSARAGSAGPRSGAEGGAESSARAGSAGPRSGAEGGAESIEIEPDASESFSIEHEAAVDKEVAEWARARGFQIGVPNRLVITKVRDAVATLEVFKAAYPPRYLRQEVEPFLTKLPLALELSWPDTALLLDVLRGSDVFDYEVNP